MPPNITGVLPNAGPSSGGLAVSIQGQGFKDGATVLFGVAQAQLIQVTPTLITALSPVVAPGPVAVTVTNLDGTTHTLVAAFTFHAPALHNINPLDGPTAGGTFVTLSGAYFALGAQVSFDGTAALSVVRTSSTQLEARSPAHAAGIVNITVTNPDGQSAQTPFTYQTPTLTGLAPAHGPITGGTNLTISGTHFTPSVTVTINGTVLPLARSEGGTSIQVVTPASAAGAVNVTVANSDGQSVTRVGAFTYDAPPTVTGVDPPAARNSDGASVTVTGTHFVNGATVTFGGVAATSVTFVNATTLTVIAPAHAAGQVDVVVTNPDEQLGTLVNGFTYVDGPAPTDNEVTFLMDGEEFFTELQVQMNAVAAAAPGPQTYVRLAFWKIDANVTLGDRNHFNVVGHTIVDYIENVVMAGHDVDVIVWYPNAKDRLKWRDFAEGHDHLANELSRIDRAAATAVVVPPAPPPGRVRIYLERYEGWTGSSNHQKFGIFSINGQRTVIMGGLNLADYYFDSDDHKLFLGMNTNQAWHDTAIRLVGPATDDVEKEWVRRWQRAIDMQASLISLNNLENQVRSRYVGIGNRNTIRQNAVAVTRNRTPQPTPFGANATVRIALTRSERSTRHRELRDLLLERIGAANHYVYMENNQFTDPEIVRALYTRKAAVPTLRVVIVTNMRDAGEGYMTRRSWLQLVLRMPHPVCVRVHYESERRGGGIRQVARAGAGTWNVHDSYDPNDPTATRWLDEDALEVDAASGGTKRIKFSRITAVECGFHFYSPVCIAQIQHPVTGVMADTLINPCMHSKLAIIDDQYLVIGSSNWTYRSMQYDGEIAAFIDGGAPGGGPTVVTQVRDRLIGHYDDLTALTLSNVGSNFENTAHTNVQNWRVNGDAAFGGYNNYMLMPLVHPDIELANVREAPGLRSMPNYTWI
ncbi:hypothetical protein F0U60_53755 [Archangium minus]|uniref:PLD phosphodiesterase domain-containing protein n=1 Tax=Archangium minus TaxID=83450 RepID=A0ABY9X9C2_9BACT|nr:hypothetical protein F0U60_53755 [Archangium minus]